MLYMRIFLSCGAYGEYESTVSSSGGHQGQQAISVDVPVTLVAPTARPDQCLQCLCLVEKFILLEINAGN